MSAYVESLDERCADEYAGMVLTCSSFVLGALWRRTSGRSSGRDFRFCIRIVRSYALGLVPRELREGMESVRSHASNSLHHPISMDDG